MSRAVVLRHHLEDDAGLIGAAFVARGYELSTILIDDAHPAPADVEGDVVVVLGSNSSVYDDEVHERWFAGELALLDSCDRRGVPILGICFGAQALCTLRGGVVAPMGRLERGWTTVEVTGDTPLSAGPWFEYHGDHCEPPADATVVAVNPYCVQAFTIDRHVAVQFHPEVDGAQLRRWFDTLGEMPRARADAHEQFVATAEADHDQMARRADELVGWFLDHAGQFA